MIFTDKQTKQAVAKIRAILETKATFAFNPNRLVPDAELISGISEVVAAVDPSPWVATPAQMAAMDAALRQAISDTGVGGNDAGASYPQAQVDAVLQGLIDAANGVA